MERLKKSEGEMMMQALHKAEEVISRLGENLENEEELKKQGIKVVRVSIITIEEATLRGIYELGLDMSDQNATKGRCPYCKEWHGGIIADEETGFDFRGTCPTTNGEYAVRVQMREEEPEDIF